MKLKSLNLNFPAPDKPIEIEFGFEEKGRNVQISMGFDEDCTHILVANKLKAMAASILAIGD